LIPARRILSLFSEVFFATMAFYSGQKGGVVSLEATVSTAR